MYRPPGWVPGLLDVGVVSDVHRLADCPGHPHGTARESQPLSYPPILRGPRLDKLYPRELAVSSTAQELVYNLLCYEAEMCRSKHDHYSWD